MMGRSRKGVVIVLEIQLISFFTKYKQRFHFGTTQVGFDLKHFVIATSIFFIRFYLMSGSYMYV